MGARCATGVWMVLLGIMAGAVPHEGDRSVVRVTKAAVDLDGVVASSVSIGTIGAVSADGCEIFGDFSTPIRSLSPSRYRGNVYRIKADSILNEIRMELQLAIDAPVDLFFYVHRTPTFPVENPPIYQRVMPVVQVPALGDGSVTLFSTGQLTDPQTGQPGLRLEAGFDYAIAVSWESIDVNYGRNSVRTPFDFLHGELLGRLLRNIAPPIPDELTSIGLTSGSTSGAYSMQLCFEPVTGACCDGLSGCDDTGLERDCTGVGSHFFGQRSTCAETVCRPGACCMPCGECASDFIPEACVEAGGATHWAGVTCPASATDLCPKLTGACCEAEVCTPDVCIDECDLIGGIFRGVGSECEPNICIGACCRDGVPPVLNNDGTVMTPGRDLPCVEVTQSFCEDPDVEGGTYLGDGTTCSTLAPADACGGACCFTIGGVSGCQEVATRADCSVGAGVENPYYRGDGTLCENNVCVGGACCFTFTENMEVFADCMQVAAEADCSVIAGLDNPDYRGDLTLCGANNACPAMAPAPTRGSCCLFESTCMDTDVDTCATLEGDFILASDPEGDCLTRSCGVAACCFADGSCVEDLTAAGCINRTGTPQASGTTCQAAMCVAPIGACCGLLPSGVCTENQTQADCEGASGVYLGDLSTCVNAAVDCPGFGACCRPEGTCFASRTQAECDTIGGILTAEAICADVFSSCEQRGACCAISGLCLFVTATECSDVGGVFDATKRCDFANVCPSGACCVGETCLQRTRAGCMVAGAGGTPGDYRSDGTTCDETVACGNVAGACCLPNSSGCVTLLPQACLDPPFEGVFQGAGVGCDSTICVTGACCLTTGNCDDDVLPSRCAERGGTLDTGFTCIQGACDPRGACCVGGDSCTNARPERQCDLLGGVLTPDTLCAELDPLCEPTGACCQPNGTCTDAIPQSQCDALGGALTIDVLCGALDPLCEPSGACCVDGQTCTDSRSQTQCDALGGVLTVDTLCADLNPPCPPLGACCLAGSCEPDMTEDDCGVSGGVYQGDASVCTTGLCALGACCPVDGNCVDGAVASECTGTEDRFTEGAACANVPCPERGACCLGETCAIRTLLQCIDAGGDFGGVGTLCDTVDRCLPGACCFEFTACDDTLSRQQCERVIPGSGTGLFGGAGTTCSQTDCRIGSCCSATAVCREPALIADCDDPEDFRPTSCLFPCEGRGACCVPGDATCRIMTPTQCSDVFGFYGGDGSTCDPADLCTEGACCLPSGNCNQRTRLLCDLGSGSFRSGGTLCTDIDCAISIVSSVPATCAIDAGQPSEPDGSATTGPSIAVTFNTSAAGLGPEHFSVVVRPGPGTAPGILGVLPGGDANTVDVRLDGPPVPGQWTCLVHNDSGTEVCIGGLPADVDGSKTSEPADVRAVLDCVSGAAVCQPWQCDADRSGACGPSDILRVIDLLGGGDAFTPWTGVTLTAPCPTLGP